MRLLGASDIDDSIKPLTKPRHVPGMDFFAAREQGRLLAAIGMAKRGLTAGADIFLVYDPTTGIYGYRFRSERDFTTRGPSSTVMFDGNSGALRKVALPTGQNSADSITNWLMALHMGNVFGLPYRIVVSVIGAMVTMLSVTGIMTWTKKRSARLLRS
jgi:uncharacterized iron-regulated membrane protein